MNSPSQSIPQTLSDALAVLGAHKGAPLQGHLVGVSYQRLQIAAIRAGLVVAYRVLDRTVVR